MSHARARVSATRWALTALVVAGVAGVAVTVILVLQPWKDETDDESIVTSPTSVPTTGPVWPDTEYAKLSRLGGGLSAAYFRDVLGTPLFTNASPDDEFVQDLYQGPGYWVQTVSDSAGSVQFMTVTSCVATFRPTLDSGGFRPMTLLETRLAELGQPWAAAYRGLAVTANRTFFEHFYEGNPGLYKTYFAGINDACPNPDAPELACEIPLVNVNYHRLDAEFNIVPFDDPEVMRFRACATINTFGESGPGFNERALEAFQLGADRILVRAAPGALPTRAGEVPTPSPSEVPTSAPATVSTAPPDPRITSALYYVYEARGAETVSEIAERFGLDAEYIVANNPEMADPPVAGTSLIIPVANGVLHEVRSGETLYTIAERYDVTTAAIVAFEANGLSGNASLGPGQLLFVPEARTGVSDN